MWTSFLVHSSVVPIRLFPFLGCSVQCSKEQGVQIHQFHFLSIYCHILILGEIPILFSIMAALIYISTHNMFPCTHILINICYIQSFVYLFLCVCMCAHVHCVHKCEHQSSIPDVFLDCTLLKFLRQNLSLHLKLIDLARLVGQRAAEIINQLIVCACVSQHACGSQRNFVELSGC